MISSALNILTIIIYSKNTTYDYQITTPSDYTVFISNMNEALWHYLNIRKRYEEMIDGYDNSNSMGRSR